MLIPTLLLVVVVVVVVVVVETVVETRDHHHGNSDRNSRHGKDTLPSVVHTAKSTANCEVPLGHHYMYRMT